MTEHSPKASKGSLAAWWKDNVWRSTALEPQSVQNMSISSNSDLTTTTTTGTNLISSPTLPYTIHSSPVFGGSGSSFEFLPIPTNAQLSESDRLLLKELSAKVELLLNRGAQAQLASARTSLDIELDLVGAEFRGSSCDEFKNGVLGWQTKIRLSDGVAVVSPWLPTEIESIAWVVRELRDYAGPQKEQL